MKRFLSRAFFVLALAAATTGCRIWDDAALADTLLALTVQAYDADNNGANSKVDDVTLYVFDDDLRLIRQIETTVDETITISVPAGSGVHIVGWGNMKTGSQACPALAAGDHKDAGYVRLAPDTRAASPHYSPGDLFHGELTLTSADMQGHKEIPIKRKVGSMNVTVKGLKAYAGFNDADYRIMVRETCNTIDFYGACCGDKAFYYPAGAFRTVNSKEIYKVDAFNMVPEPTGVNVDIYHGSTLVYTATASNTGTPIAVQAGRLTEVEINFEGTVSVTVSLIQWDSNKGDIEF